jgi:hypothetical protein
MLVLQCRANAMAPKPRPAFASPPPFALIVFCFALDAATKPIGIDSGSRKKSSDWPIENLISRVAEYPLGAKVPVADTAPAVGRKCAVISGVFNEEAEKSGRITPTRAHLRPQPSFCRICHDAILVTAFLHASTASAQAPISQLAADTIDI